MNNDQLIARAQLWDEVLRSLLADLTRVGTTKLDALDAAEYTAALEPIETLIMSGKIASVQDETIRAVRRSIRDNEFRPTYSKVEGYVPQALGMSAELLSGADAAARRIVSREAAEEAFKAEQKRLPSMAEHPGRVALREKIRRFRGQESGAFNFPPDGLREMPWPGDEASEVA